MMEIAYQPSIPKPREPTCNCLASILFMSVARHLADSSVAARGAAGEARRSPVIGAGSLRLCPRNPAERH